ncbi:PDR/VanB family oxidoreductase [Mycobacterium sp. ITM-2016-00317]|uniref:PDR/VanB family oxidoreductase n=1 Tax=Mycobacterium sp. ITM-2016-00317 TaxID=2099694 RepID=UPI00287FB5C1|nr:PDR/VanB family oxidoreductase [Mycobacterium sp. ITM-2016-00317]WNG85399.1 PDR/VanB family oxidoreductase [Mycobacterium sp. ITM-2016-00317]
MNSATTLPARLKVSAIQQEAEGVVSMELCSEDDAPLPVWTPGAHIEIELADKLVRHYSLCGTPADAQRWRIAVLREDDSRGGSELIHDSFRPGRVVSASWPRNNFALVDADRYLFVAGGIGITPILPMVHEVARCGKPWTLLYGGRTRGSMAFVEELSTVPGGDLYVLPHDEHGLLDLDRFLGSPEPQTAVYCCGPGSLIDAVELRCASWPTGALHLERFTPRELPALGPDGQFEVQLAGTGTTLRVQADRTLLEVLEDAGIEIDNSCRAGICGTCEVRVLGGIPEHHDDVLSDSERESREIILPCVSRSRSAVLVVDL